MRFLFGFVRGNLNHTVCTSLRMSAAQDKVTKQTKFKVYNRLYSDFDYYCNVD